MSANMIRKKTLSSLNQLLLPQETTFEEFLSINNAWYAIKSLKVRGAPGIFGLLNLVEHGHQDNLINLIWEK